MVAAADEFPERARDAWSDAENMRLVEGIRQGLSVVELAAAHRRSRRAISRQVEGYLPAGVKLGGVAAVEWLRTQLARDAGYDWRGPLRARRRTYWSVEDDAELRAGWDARTDLPLVARELGVSEMAAHRRLVRLRLSDGEAATVARMGCTAGSMLEARSRRQRGEELVALTLLLISGVPAVHGTPGYQLSLCSSREAGHAEVHKLTEELRERYRRGDAGMAGSRELSWLLGVRRVDRGPDMELGPDEGDVIDLTG
jgi:hypothetical protein